MNIKNKLFSLCGVTLVLSPTIMCACSQKKDVEWVIFAPSNKTANFVLKKDQTTATLKFYGFSYENIPSDKQLSVESTFELEGAEITCSIINLNPNLKSFDVEVVIDNCKSINNLTGKFIFKIDDKKIKFEDSFFYINIVDYVSIHAGSQTEAAAAIVGVKATTTFNGFTYDGTFAPENLKCNFVTSSLVSSECQLINISEENKTFDVQLTINGADPNTTIAGVFQFELLGQKIDFDGGTISYLIDVFQDKVIIESVDKNKNVFCTGTESSSLIFNNFYFAGITQVSDIKVTASFENLTTGEGRKTLDAKIINFDQSKQSFDIQISDLKASDKGSWEGKFTFTCDDKVLLKTQYFYFNIYCPITDDLLNIESVVEEGITTITLKGLKGSVTDFDTLLVPYYVQKIDNNAFNGVFDKEGSAGNIKHVFFEENSVLSVIGENAFKGCGVLEGDITLPRSIQKIDDCAFMSCWQLKGTLTIPYNAAGLNIDQYAFNNCRFNKLNIESYIPGVLPDWNGGYDIFYGWNTTGDNKITICQRSFENETFKTNLMKCLVEKYGLPATGWEFEKSSKVI